MAIKLCIIFTIFVTQNLCHNISQKPTLQKPPKDTNFQTRIYGGKPATAGQIPYQVGLLIRPKADSLNKFWCGGTLISNEYVLTAAHCIVQEETGQLRHSVIVYLGAIDIDNSNEKGQIRVEVPQQNLIKHNAYNSELILHDIALIKLPSKIKFNDRIKKADLPLRDQTKIQIVGKTIISSGWGDMGSPYSTPSILQYMQTKVIPGEKCSNVFGPDSFNDNQQICINSPGKSACQGDSGGPHILNQNGKKYIIGITSYGAGTCTKGYPQVLTRVSAYLDWICEKSGINV